MKVYMQRKKLTGSLGRISSGVPKEQMLVQTDLCMVGCLLDEIGCAAMVIHMSSHDTLMVSLLHMYFIESLYEPLKQRLFLKSRELHIRSSSDLHRNKHHGYVSVSEMKFNQLDKVPDAVANMMCRVFVIQPRSNRVHIDMLPFSWLIIKKFIQEKTSSMKLPVFHDDDVPIQTINRGVLVTPD
jgi:hypothetical protein